MSKEPKLFNSGEVLDGLATINAILEAIFMMAAGLDIEEERSAFQTVAESAKGRVRDLSGYIEECRRQEGK